MRIYDSDNDKTIDNVTLYLTVDEAKELYDDLAGLIERPAGNHAHINSSDYQIEITMCIYDVENLDLFDEKTKTVLTSAPS
ncbi:MAG: hypothetical protein KAR13_01355 [Desulfobulbaceae bacterium]|nr:hypothetical protein [Desulfobulbaceae bacterium]